MGAVDNPDYPARVVWADSVSVLRITLPKLPEAPHDWSPEFLGSKWARISNLRAFELAEPY